MTDNSEPDYTAEAVAERWPDRDALIADIRTYGDSRARNAAREAQNALEITQAELDRVRKHLEDAQAIIDEAHAFATQNGAGDLDHPLRERLQRLKCKHGGCSERPDGYATGHTGGWESVCCQCLGIYRGRRQAIEDLKQTVDDLSAKQEATCVRCGHHSAVGTLTFAFLRRRNVQRCEDVFHPLRDWSPTDWACAMAGEAGELCNVVKKMRRLDGADAKDDTPDRRDSLTVEAAVELADTVIYADLVAARLGIDLGRAVIAKFNAVSVTRGSSFKL